MAKKPEEDLRIGWIFGEYMALRLVDPEYEHLPCEYCCFNNPNSGCDSRHVGGKNLPVCSREFIDYIYRPISEFPPERLAKFRLTGEDDG